MMPAEPAHTLALTPQGHLTLIPSDEPALPFAIASRLVMAAALGRGSDSGPLLLALGAEQVGAALHPVAGWWRDVAVRYLTALCTLPPPETGGGAPGRVPAPDAGDLQTLIWSAPPMDGAEYLSVEVLKRIWLELDQTLHDELAHSGQALDAFLKERNPAWNLVGRVHVHLAENRKDEQFPFAFLATYSTRLSAQGKAQHRPLGEALREYAAAADKGRLLALLAPLQKAAEHCVWLKGLIDLDPAAPDQHQTPAAGEEAFHLGSGQRFAVERNGHREVEQRILADLRRLPPAHGGADRRS